MRSDDFVSNLHKTLLLSCLSNSLLSFRNLEDEDKEIYLFY